MNSGSITGWLTAAPSPRPVRIDWQDGRIRAVQPADAAPDLPIHLAAPLCDLQVNGYAGIDFQQDDLEVEALLQAVRGLRRDGCTRFFLTLITEEWPRLTARLRHLVGQRGRHPELAAAIMGWHLEGPFLSAEPGYAGAHDPACMIDPAPALIDELRAAAGGQPLLLTMAPERPGALAAIRHARAHGVRLQLGHTNAPAAILREAADRDGSLWFTHLGNGCPQQLDRHDNILWRALDLEGLGTSLIPDGIHVSPALFRLIHHRKAGRIYYTTDAMSAAGAPPGRHRLGRLELEVGADGVVRQPGRTNLAGSACTPVEGVFRAAAMLGESWAPAWQRFSEIPARLGGCPPLLVPGAPADFCVLRWEDPGGEARGLRPILQTVVGGVMGDPRAAGA